MTEFQIHASLADSGPNSSLPPDTIQYNQSPSQHEVAVEAPQFPFPSVPREPRPTLSPSSSSSSRSSYGSSDARDRPPTPPPSSTRTGGFRLPRFSLWGRNTPDTLLSESNNSLSPPSNVEADLNKLRVSRGRAQSQRNSTHVRRRHLASESGSPSRLPSSSTGAPMPTLAVNPPPSASPMSSPKLGSVWRLGGGLFASSSSPASRLDPQHGRPQTAEASTPRDFAHGTPASQFAAWSELMQGPAPPNRTATFSSISSASCSSCSRPDIKKIRSQESIKSSASALPCDGKRSASSSYSTIPVPKVIKTKLRSKSKAVELDFDNVFLAQELRISSSNPAQQARSPSLVQEDLPVSFGAESRRKRSSWAPRRSTSPHAVPDRHLASQQINAARSSDDQEEDVSLHIRPARVDRQLSTSSHLTTASSTTTSSHACEATQPRSPRINGELEPPEASRGKRSKSASPKHKTYALQFSLDGRYLAAAGSDHLIRVYEVISSPTDRADEIELAHMHQRAEQGCQRRMSTACAQSACAVGRNGTKADVRAATPELAPVFKSTPVQIFAGHTGDVLDLSWSKNNFLLSCSTDKTAKLWHPNRSECLCTFSTSATVSSVDFHPTDDRFFVTGGLDGKLRLWNITARRVQSINDVPGVITAVAFSSSGAAVCVGTYSGSILTFSCTDSLNYVNAVTVKSAAASKSTQASKITSIQPVKLDVSAPPSTATTTAPEYMTVTSNDSRVRIYSIASRRLISRFKSTSYINRSSQIRATSSSDSQFIVSGSEDASIHIWSLTSNASVFAGLFAGIKRNKSIVKGAQAAGSDAGDNSTWRSWHAGTGSVRCAIFAPNAACQLLRSADDPLESQKASSSRSRIIVSADDSNAIRIWRSDPNSRLF